MKINQQYLRDLLIAFEDTDGPETTLTELETAGFDADSNDFIFHMRLLDDRGLVMRTDGEAGFGHEQALDGYYWINVPLRLTATGHDFIANLRQQEVWQTIKTGFKDEGLTTLISVAKSLAEGFAKKKVKDLTGFDM
ncbi:hypothetical protein SRABI106_01381 [Rahnella aquatilis]|nr:hypothetical protein SRABI106_01381 [Rahnella aquatilis]